VTSGRHSTCRNGPATTRDARYCTGSSTHRAAVAQSQVSSPLLFMT
jgi:hypothetical protein